jgi:hypothetical protein
VENVAPANDDGQIFACGCLESGEICQKIMKMDPSEKLPEKVCCVSPIKNCVAGKDDGYYNVKF